MAKHPIQPIELDNNGINRFKENKIVRYILDKGGINLNDIAMVGFTNEDQQQFAQLIGYSLGGYSDLSYVDDASYYTAAKMLESGLDERDARIEHLEDVLKTLKNGLKEPVALLYEIHPDDLIDKGGL